VFEIQENSDTTYRIHDWNRTGPDGKSRELHIEQALKAINFEDHKPTCCPENWITSNGFSSYIITDQPDIFRLSHVRMDDSVRSSLPSKGPHLIAVTHNTLALNSQGITLELAAGQFALVPASAGEVTIQGQDARFLLTQPA
jgi:mannose-6-phosphate isomerase